MGGRRADDRETGDDTVPNVRSIWIKNFEATVENGKIKKYRVNGKISFVPEG